MDSIKGFPPQLPLGQDPAGEILAELRQMHQQSIQEQQQTNALLRQLVEQLRYPRAP